MSIGHGSESDQPRAEANRTGDRSGAGASGSPLLTFRPLAACTLAAIAAGLLAFAFGETTYDSFDPGEATRQVRGGAVILPTPEEVNAAAAKNTALADAGLGALLGLSLGLAGGLLRGDWRRGLVGGGVGFALGGVVGGLAPLGLMRLAFILQDRHEVDTLVAGTAAQAAAAGLIAAAAGVAFGLASGGARAIPRSATLGLFGGAAGALIYAVLGAAAFPLAETDRAIATERTPRLLAHLLVALGAGMGLGLGLTDVRRRSRRGSLPDPSSPDAPAPPVTPGAS